MKKIIAFIFALCLMLGVTACRKEEVRKPSSEEEAEIVLYFPDKDVMYLHPEKRMALLGRDKIEVVILRELFKGPENTELVKSVSGDVKVLSVDTKDGICTVDLSEEFKKYNTGGSAKESMVIYSIVNSLCELENVDQVKINIEGDVSAQFGGHFVLDEAFLDNQDLVLK